VGIRAARIAAVTFSADGRRLVAAARDGTVGQWNLGARTASPAVTANGPGPIEGLAFAHDGHHVVSLSKHRGSVELWPGTWRDAKRRPQPLPGGALISATFGADTATRLSNDAYPMAFSDDDRYLAAAGSGNVVRVWDLRRRGSLPRLLREDFGPASITGLAFDHDDHVMVADGNGIVRVWGVHCPCQRAVVLRSTQRSLNAVTVARDGGQLATADRDGTVHVWDWRTPSAPAANLHGHRGQVFDVAFSRDGHSLASAGSDGTIRIWDWREPSIPATVIHVSGSPARHVVFAPDGHRLASGGDDGAVRMWDCQRCGDLERVLRSARARVSTG